MSTIPSELPATSGSQPMVGAANPYTGRPIDRPKLFALHAGTAFKFGFFAWLGALTAALTTGLILFVLFSVLGVGFGALMRAIH